MLVINNIAQDLLCNFNEAPRVGASIEILAILYLSNTSFEALIVTVTDFPYSSFLPYDSNGSVKQSYRESLGYCAISL